jgi:hypothetical protein
MDPTQNTPAAATISLPAPQTGALTAPDDDDDAVDSLAGAQPDIGKQIAQNTIVAGQQNKGNPRAWAENAVAGVNAALAGIGAGEEHPSGWLAGIGNAARANVAQRQNQQEMKLKQQQQLSEQQIANAQVAHLNAEKYNMERGWRNQDRDFQQKLTENDGLALESRIASGAATYGDNLTAADIAKKINPKTGKPEVNGHEVQGLRSGLIESTDANGKPILDADGLPKMEPRFTLVDAHAETTPSDKVAKFITDSTGLPVEANKPMDGVRFQTLFHQASVMAAQQADIDAKRAMIGKDAADANKAEGEAEDAADKRAAAKQVGSIMGPLRAKANGDEGLSFRLLRQNGTAEENQTVDKAYGPGTVDNLIKDYDDELDKQTDFQIRNTENEIAKQNANTFKNINEADKAEKPIEDIWTGQKGFGRAIAQVEQTKNAIIAGADGNGLMTSLVPTMEVLGLNSSAGINRIQPAEAVAAGAPGGWTEQWNAWATKAMTGKITSQLALQGQQLMNTIIQAQHKNAVQESDLRVRNAIARGVQVDPSTITVMDINGRPSTLDQQIQAYNPAPPARPKTVPPNAVWNPKVSRWQLPQQPQ